MLDIPGTSGFWFCFGETAMSLAQIFGGHGSARPNEWDQDCRDHSVRLTDIPSLQQRSVIR